MFKTTGTAEVYRQEANRPNTRTLIGSMFVSKGGNNEYTAANLAKVPDEYLIAVQRKRIKGRQAYLVVTLQGFQP